MGDPNKLMEEIKDELKECSRKLGEQGQKEGNKVSPYWKVFNKIDPMEDKNEKT